MTANRWIVVLAAAAGLTPGLRAQAPSQITRPEIVTNGSGEVRLPPDRALLRLGVTTRGQTATAASAPNGPRVKRVQDALAAQGLTGRAVRVVSFALTPVVDYQRGSTITEYQARTTLEVSLPRVPALGSVLDAAVGAGATEVDAISFSSDSAEVARGRALAMALAKARADAEALAAAAGGTLGMLQLVTTSPGMEAYDNIELRDAATAAAPSPLSIPGVEREVIVRVRIQARWAFVPRG